MTHARDKWGATVRAGFFLARGKAGSMHRKKPAQKEPVRSRGFRIPGFARSWNSRGLSFTTAASGARVPGVCAHSVTGGARWAHSHDERPRARLRVRFLPRAEFPSSRVSF